MDEQEPIAKQDPLGEASAPRTDLKPEEKTWGMLAHLAALCGYVIPLANIIGPVVVYFMKKDESEYVKNHAKEAINFQISATIYMIVAAVLILVVIGLFLLIAIGIAALVLTIIAALKANEGRTYRYPYTIRFI